MREKSDTKIFDVIMDFCDTMKDTPQQKSNDFFPKEIIQKVSGNLDIDYRTVFRQPSEEESELITDEAFQLLLFWVKKGDITPDFFERFLAILVSFADRIEEPIDENHLPSMIEIISLAQYTNQVIHTTIELFTLSPYILKKPYEIIH